MEARLIEDIIGPDNYPLTLTTCEYHWEQRTNAIRNVNHPRHKKYILFACTCKVHQQLQE